MEATRCTDGKKQAKQGREWISKWTKNDSQKQRDGYRRVGNNSVLHYDEGVAQGQRDDMPTADGRSTVAKIAADLRPSADGSADGSAVRTSLVTGGTAGSQRVHNLSSFALGQTDGRTYRRTDRAILKCLPMAGV